MHSRNTWFTEGIDKQNRICYIIDLLILECNDCLNEMKGDEDEQDKTYC
jgi:hypothetical protein